MSKKVRPYPLGISWDEALLQRERADAAEAKLDAIREAVAWEMECSEALSEYFGWGFWVNDAASDELVESYEAAWKAVVELAGCAP